MDGKINLSYSYMTFVMQEHKKVKTYEDYLFDQEQFNYIIDKRTALHDADFVQDSGKLQFLLKNFEEIDPDLNKLLLYYYQDTDNEVKNTDIVTPLHIAVHNDFVRSINILLKYLARLDYASFQTFKSIMPDLLDYTGIIDFLYEQPFQTIQTMQKLTLRVEERMSDNIVAIGESFTQYVDTAYYYKYMGERPDEFNYSSYPVKMWIVEINWIICQDEGDHGYKFLEKLSTSNNLDLFDLDFFKIVIGYLYKRFTVKILSIKLTFFVVRLTIFVMTVGYHERLQDRLEEEGGLEGPQSNPYESFLGYINMIVSFLLLVSVVFQSCYLGKAFWLNKWTILELNSGILNIAISALILTGSRAYLGILRHLEAFVTLLFAIHSLYFLQMIESISSYIIIWFKVVESVAYFLCALLCIFLGFASASYMIGRNQLQFDEVPAEWNPYQSRPLGSLAWVYFMLLLEVRITMGEPGSAIGINSFEIGKQS